MERAEKHRIHDAWWAAILIFVTVAGMVLCWALFTGALTRSVPVTLTSERSGLVMESGAKVKMRGVHVGRVAGVEGGQGPVRLRLELFPDKVDRIPANIEAQIRANTMFGAKYVDLVYPDEPSAQHISAGAVLSSRNVSTEVNTVFQSLVDVLHQIDPPKLNAVLSAVADAVRGRGERMGEAITATSNVLAAVNPRMGTIQQDWRSIQGASDAYSVAAQDILKILNAASTTSVTITNQVSDLDALLLNAAGFAQSGIDLLGPNKDNFVHAINVLEPTTSLLMKYNPIYTCLLQGAKWTLDNGIYDAAGGDHRTVMLDDAFILGDDPYRYPDNLPVVAAKGGPGGEPSCGSLPDVTKNWPVRQLVTNTGFGTGMDIRPNPGIGFPGWANYFPVTRAVPEPPSIRYPGPPAPGPIPYPGAPPYGVPPPPPPPAPVP
ncbi:MCE family protein [Mycolicibacterium setense]|uniref:MCE family protein n=1 Tax=Mycolicibacterium setense TaxID=431269 RepID=UPI00068F795C|nr:MCE family protein [Mycolicibacterium setense]MCV7114214.1 MCE family protein [Mycolicibacterium setense]